MATLKFEHIEKVYDNGVQAVFDFNLDVEDKDFVVFVGPSGCGKSTTLRMVAGLEEITSGDLYIDDVRVNEVEPKDRDIAMVFQSYALYPHMSVYDNMAFGLKLRHFPKEEIDKRVRNAAEILGLTSYLDRKPKALSGGQRQRVALGRAIVRNAKVFLMDEPLSNLDAKLRVKMRTEIAKLHKQLGATTIYVTHDQIEAMTMATKIVIIKDGVIQQVGAPKDIYDNPANLFVATFIGTPETNILLGKVNENKEFVSVYEEDGVVKEGSLKLKVNASDFKLLKDNGYIGKEVYLGIRPEDISDKVDAKKDAPSIEITNTELLGAETYIHFEIDGTHSIAKVPARVDLKEGDQIKLDFNMDKVHFFDKESTNVIKEGMEKIEVKEEGEKESE